MLHPGTIRQVMLVLHTCAAQLGQAGTCSNSSKQGSKQPARQPCSKPWQYLSSARAQVLMFPSSFNVAMLLCLQGDAKVPLTLYLGNASFYLNISKDTMPGVEFTRATYLLSGDIVATADLANNASWQQVSAADVDWTAVQRLDTPVVIDPDSDAPPAKGRIIGVNSTLTQQCTPTRAMLRADGSAAPAVAAADSSTAPASTATSAAGGSSSSALQVLVSGAAAAVLGLAGL